MKTEVLFFVLFFFTFSCLNNNSKGIDRLTIPNKKNGLEINADSLIEAKYKLKEKILDQYSNIPLSIFESSDKRDYSKYREVVKLDSLFNIYSKCSLSDKEQQLFAIIKFKTKLKLLDYTSALKELELISFNEDFENYKNVLLGVAYSLKGDIAMRNKIFNNLFEKFESYPSKDNRDCNKYLMLKVLSNSNDLNICKDKLEDFEYLKSMGNVEIIKNYFLTDVEL